MDVWVQNGCMGTNVKFLKVILEKHTKQNFNYVNE